MPSGSETTAESATGGQAAEPVSSGAAAGSPTSGTGARDPGQDRAGGDRPAGRPGRPGRLRRLRALARREWRRSAVAAVAGIGLGLSFPPYGLWPLSLLAVAALSLLTRGRTARQGAWTGFALGLPFFVLLLKWLHVVGWDAAVGLAAIEALFFLPLGAGIAFTSRFTPPALRALWPLWTACLWVAQEWARDRVPFGGFPWGRLAFANTSAPFVRLAALGGAPLVTFGVALAGALLATLALAGRRTLTRRSPRSVLAAVGAAVLVAAVAAAGYAVPVPTKADDTVDVAVVQGNVQRPGMDFLGRPMKILNNHVDATLKLAKEVRAGRVAKPDLVLWPENSSDLDPFQYREAYARIDEAVKAIGVPVLVGALVDDPTKPGYILNQGIVWDPKTGPGASYTKQHPVPFGEYVPFRHELSKVITRLQRIPRDFYPGDHSGVLRVGPARLGDVICFEVAYDAIVRDTVNAGARAIVVQTNNATYGRTGQPQQQLVMSKLRAIEHGRAVVTAATSGISAVVEPDGTVQQQTKEFTQDVLTARLPLRDGTTVADHVGAVPEWVLAMVGVLSCAAAITLGRRGRTNEKGQDQ